MSRHHDELMRGYYSARQAQEQRAEEWSMGYATETALFYAEEETRVTFKQWLISQRRER